MLTTDQLLSIASSLDSYRTQFTAISHSLAALRVASDEMIAQLEQDRDALATHLQAALDAAASAAAAEVEIQHTGPATATAASVDAAQLDEPLDVAELSAEPAGDDAPAVLDADAIGHELGATAEIDLEAVTELQAFEPETAALTEETIAVETETAIASPVAEEVVTAETTAPTVSDDAAVPGEPAATAAEVATPADNVINLADRRKPPAAPRSARRRAMAVVASLVITASASLGLHELLQTELGQRMMLELGTCDGDMLSVTRDCGLLSWLMI